MLFRSSNSKRKAIEGYQVLVSSIINRIPITNSKMVPQPEKVEARAVGANHAPIAIPTLGASLHSLGSAIADMLRTKPKDVSGVDEPCETFVTNAEQSQQELLLAQSNEIAKAAGYKKPAVKYVPMAAISEGTQLDESSDSDTEGSEKPAELNAKTTCEPAPTTHQSVFFLEAAAALKKADQLLSKSSNTSVEATVPGKFCLYLGPWNGSLRIIKATSHRRKMQCYAHLTLQQQRELQALYPDIVLARPINMLLEQSFDEVIAAIKSLSTNLIIKTDMENVDNEINDAAIEPSPLLIT